MFELLREEGAGGSELSTSSDTAVQYGQIFCSGVRRKVCLKRITSSTPEAERRTLDSLCLTVEYQRLQGMN